MRISADSIWILAAASLLLVPLAATAQIDDPGDRGLADDAVRRVLLTGNPVPTTIFDVRLRLARDLRGTLRPHIVVNGGHDNPARGDPAGGVKFMVFETYRGPPGVEPDELFIGYFLGPNAARELMVLPGFVELIAWDRTKRVYNFWELDDGGWHYRGDSNDIAADVAKIHLGAPGPAFPQRPRLRCSGCHTLGAPVMKELAPPHNDWWTTARRANLGPFTLRSGNDLRDPVQLAARLFADAADASDLGEQVRQGISRLVATRMQAGANGPTLKEQLRSLFGTMEMNLVSDSAAFGDPARTNVSLPQAFFVDARLVSEIRPIAVSKALYVKALQQVGSQFARSEVPGLLESHHAFVVPARSHIDDRMIDALIRKGLLDEELVADVLAIDFTTPVYSRKRVRLMEYVPERATNVADLRAKLADNLSKAPAEDLAARELLANITDVARSADAHRRSARAYLDACASAASEIDAVVDWLKLASQRRIELETAETARHPDGNIKEAGFRVIFPHDRVDPSPSKLRLDPLTARSVRQ